MQQFLKVEDTPVQPGIVVDHREDASFDELLRQRQVRVQRRQLEIGDFVCSDRCVVERKTREDFENSILDGRLFTQLKHLIASYSRVVVIIEGEEASGRISKEALLGAYSSVVVDFGASLFFTRDKETSAELVYAIAKHEQRTEKRPLRIYARRKALTLSQVQRSMVEMFPMVGPKLAKALLERFGNIENIIHASERELLEVEGLGKKLAKIVRNVIREPYQSGKDEIDFL